MATNKNFDDFNDINIPEEDKPIDYKALIFEYLIHWPWLVGSLIVCLVAAYIYLRYQAPVYSARTTVLIKQGDKSKNAAAGSTFSAMEDMGMLSMASNFDNEVEIIQSRTLVQKVVNELNLNTSYKMANPFGYDRELYKQSPVEVWMAPEEAERLSSPLNLNLHCQPDGKVNVQASFTHQGQEGELGKDFERLPAVLITPVGTVTLTADTTNKVKETQTVQARIISPLSAALSCKERLTGRPTTKSTTIIQLTYNDTQKQRSIDFLNTLVAQYNQDANDDKNEVASRTAEFIDSRIRIINQELGTTESKLASFKQQAGITDINADAQIALQGSSEYRQRQAENATQLRLVEFLNSYIEDPQNQYEVIPANVGLTDQGLSSIIEKYNEMLIERKRLLRSSSENNPAVINLNTAIEATRHSVVTSVNSVKKGLEITRKNLEIEARKYDSRINAAPQQEKEFISISRQQEIKASLYLLLLQKREENAITLAATANNGRIVETPLAGGKVAPQSGMFYLIALVLGLALPVGGIFLYRFLRFKIESRADVERITDIPIIGDIPQTAETKKGAIVVHENRNGLMEEVFRSVRTNVQYMLRKGQKVILFTSTTSGEGKSFTAGNLAVSFAMMGKRTVIVGLDIRKPGLNKVFNISRRDNGITQYLSDPEHTPLMELCQPSTISPNLFILPGGVVPPNPTELVARETLDQAIETLKAHFDYIILDTAPIGVVTDTQLIARVADLSIYVCRAEYTHKSDYQLINDLRRENKLPHLCTLINGIDMDKRRNGYYYGYGKYGHYGKYGYGKKYGYGYGYGYSKEK